MQESIGPAGAVEFMTKAFKDDVRLDATRAAIDRSRATLVEDSQTWVSRDCYISLTVRECQIMKLVVSGVLKKQVGGELGISEAIVRAYRSQVMRKMKAGSLPDLVTMVAHLGVRSEPTHSQSADCPLQFLPIRSSAHSTSIREGMAETRSTLARIELIEEHRDVLDQVNLRTV